MCNIYVVSFLFVLYCKNWLGLYILVKREFILLEKFSSMLIL